MKIIITTGIFSITIFITGLIIFLKWTYKYWERRNIPFDQPVMPFGSFADVIWKQNKPFGFQVKHLYQTAKMAGFREYGLFVLWRPVYVPVHLQIIKHILCVDSNIFINRGIYHNKKTDPLSCHLFALDGQEWRNLRTKLTPTFTSGKIKMMIQAVIHCGEQLKKFTDHLASLGEPIEIRDLSGQFTTDVIGSCAFGVDCNSFENPNSDFIINCKNVFDDTLKRKIKNFFAFVWPTLAKKIGLTLTEDAISKFFLGLVKDTMEYRDTNNIVRDDFMQLLLNLRNQSNLEDQQFNLEEITAQAFIFFLAGYETSSTTMAFCLFELAQNTDIQDKVREEIESVLEKYDQKITYKAVMEMKYLRQTIDETLRKHPTVTLLLRQNNADYQIPGSENILDKGTSIFISVLGLHHDAEYFPDPENFDPDRFNDNNKSKINPYTYLPFGEGPRSCIGLRFGILQTKIGLIYLLKNFIFSLNEKTSIPLIMDPTSTTLGVLGGIWLNITSVE